MAAGASATSIRWLVNASHLMIADPLRNPKAMFSMHPPMTDRIQRLEGMARALGQG